jgi:hypothetical protein
LFDFALILEKRRRKESVFAPDMVIDILLSPISFYLKSSFAFSPDKTNFKNKNTQDLGFSSI